MDGMLLREPIRLKTHRFRGSPTRDVTQRPPGKCKHVEPLFSPCAFSAGAVVPVTGLSRLPVTELPVLKGGIRKQILEVVWKPNLYGVENNVSGPGQDKFRSIEHQQDRAATTQLIIGRSWVPTVHPISRLLSLPARIFTNPPFQFSASRQHMHPVQERNLPLQWTSIVSNPSVFSASGFRHYFRSKNAEIPPRISSPRRPVGPGLHSPQRDPPRPEPDLFLLVTLRNRDLLTPFPARKKDMTHRQPIKTTIQPAPAPCCTLHDYKHLPTPQHHPHHPHRPPSR